MRFVFKLLLALPAVFAAPTPEQDIIPGSWIVQTSKDAVLEEIISFFFKITGVHPTYEYSFGSFKGFAIDGVESLPMMLDNFPGDITGDITGDLTESITDILNGIFSMERNTRVFASALTSQRDAPWGLARISHHDKGATDYIYDNSAGAGTYSYIIDTGIFTTHTDFKGHAEFGHNFVEGTPDTDENGHGTHVAGTVGSQTYGVAKKTTLIAVKVLGAEGSGSSADVIAGIDWAVNDAKAKNRIGKTAVNISLGGFFSETTNKAVAEAVRQGLFVAVAAGNDGFLASKSSPASEVSACTVGATDKDDKLAMFSNYGSLVDVLAPGVDVKSTWIGGADNTNTISGTSMATPHVTGLGAYLLGLEGAMTPAKLCERIQSLSTKNKVSLGFFPALFDTKNQLAFNGNYPK